MVYSIYKGYVIAGQGIGSKELLPTINLEPSVLGSDFGFGVYSCFVYVLDKKYLAMMHYGRRSTDSNISLEFHVIDQIIDLELTTLTFQPIKYIRGVLEFESLHDLKKQLGLDLIKIVNND